MIGAMIALAGAAAIPAATTVAAPAGETAAEALPKAEQLLPEGTPVRLMILREINSRHAIVGERFKLRVIEPVYINGKPVVPIGAAAWGEIASTERNGAVGKGGRLGAKLLYLDLPDGAVPLRGEYSDRGDGNGAGVVLAVIGFGPLGLLNAGDSARLKAGDTFTGYVAGPASKSSPYEGSASSQSAVGQP